MLRRKPCPPNEAGWKTKCYMSWCFECIFGVPPFYEMDNQILLDKHKTTKWLKHKNLTQAGASTM